MSDFFFKLRTQQDMALTVIHYAMHDGVSGPGQTNFICWVLSETSITSISLVLSFRPMLHRFDVLLLKLHCISRG